MFNYTVIIHTPQELNHSSYIQTGLFELEKRGIINVKIKLSIKKNKGRVLVDNRGGLQSISKPHPKTSFYTLIDHTTNKEISFATDLYDHAEHFSQTALDKCDFYFKRNYESRFVDPVQKKAKTKIEKLGIVFGTHSAHKRKDVLFFLGIFLSNLRINLKWDKNIFVRLYKVYRAQKRHWKFINSTRMITLFERYKKAQDSTIMFQTRCFLHERDMDVQEIHQQRYHIIKLLRKHFPDKFLGGFVPSKIAKEKYGDALTNVPTIPEEYLNAMKKAKIVIYTRGLANSPAWKMAEYLSQGKVIIAEPLTAELPMPLTEGKEVLFFNSDAELIKMINAVLDDKNLAEYLSKNARAYFEKYVHPFQNTKRILELMLNKTLT